MSNTNKTDATSKKKVPVVCVGRQFGCGGREIGRLIARALEADYYDKTLLSQAAQSLGFSRSLFDSADEKRPSWLRSMLQFNYGIENAVSEFSDIDNESLYSMQSKVIREIADRRPCVIVGRTADYILRDHPGLLSIFLHSPVEHRVRNILKRKDAASEDQARAMTRKMDNARESYYSYYTNRKWGRAETYHLCLDTSRFTPEQIVEIVKAYYNS